MSFGVGIGDFIAVMSLANQLYQNVYKVARAAPTELKSLEDDLAVFSQALGFLVTELQNPRSLLNQAGADRVRMVIELKDQAKDTLLKLEDIAERHDLIKNAEKPRLRKLWDRTKFAHDAPKITKLRARLQYHSGVLQLLLTSVGNSSLERLEAESQAMKANIKQIMQNISDLPQKIRTENADFLYAEEARDVDGYGLPGYSALPRIHDKTRQGLDGETLSLAPAMTSQRLYKPLLSAVEGASSTTELSEKLLAMAETRGLWPTIGLAAWYQAGKWWLMKGQAAIRLAKINSYPIDSQGYADLLKASWIMIDVINEHPQRNFTWSKSDQHLVQTLSKTISLELEKLKALGLPVPSLKDILAVDLSIWPSDYTGELSVQSAPFTIDRATACGTSELLVFQRFCRFTTEQIYVSKNAAIIDCVINVFLDSTASDLRIIIQDSSGTERLNTCNLVNVLEAIKSVQEIENQSSFDRSGPSYSIELHSAADRGLLEILLCSFLSTLAFYGKAPPPNAETILTYTCLNLLVLSSIFERGEIRSFRLLRRPDSLYGYSYTRLLSLCELRIEAVEEFCENTSSIIEGIEPNPGEVGRNIIRTIMDKILAGAKMTCSILYCNNNRQAMSYCSIHEWNILKLLLQQTPESRLVKSHLERLRIVTGVSLAYPVLLLVSDPDVDSEGKRILLSQFYQISIAFTSKDESQEVASHEVTAEVVEKFCEVLCQLVNSHDLELAELLVHSFHRYILQWEQLPHFQLREAYWPCSNRHIEKREVLFKALKQSKNLSPATKSLAVQSALEGLISGNSLYIAYPDEFMT